MRKWTAPGQGQGKTASARCTWFLLSSHSPRSLVVWRKVFEDNPFRQFRSAAATRLCSVHYVYAFQLVGQMERLHRIDPDSSTSRLQLLVRRLHEIRLAPSAPQRGVLICRSSLSRTSQVPVSSGTRLLHPFSSVLNLPRSPAVHPVSQTLDRLLVFSLIVRTPIHIYFCLGSQTASSLSLPL